jgi:uncharacterized protein DUF3606
MIDKSKTGNGDRNKMARGDDFEVHYLAKKIGISAGAVRELIRQHGNNRPTLEREARKLKGR